MYESHSNIFNVTVDSVVEAALALKAIRFMYSCKLPVYSCTVANMWFLQFGDHYGMDALIDSATLRLLQALNNCTASDAQIILIQCLHMSPSVDNGVLALHSFRTLHQLYPPLLSHWTVSHFVQWSYMQPEVILTLLTDECSSHIEQRSENMRFQLLRLWAAGPVARASSRKVCDIMRLMSCDWLIRIDKLFYTAVVQHAKELTVFGDWETVRDYLTRFFNNPEQKENINVRNEWLASSNACRTIYRESSLVMRRLEQLSKVCKNPNMDPNAVLEEGFDSPAAFKTTILEQESKGSNRSDGSGDIFKAVDMLKCVQNDVQSKSYRFTLNGDSIDIWSYDGYLWTVRLITDPGMCARRSDDSSQLANDETKSIETSSSQQEQQQDQHHVCLNMWLVFELNTVASGVRTHCDGHDLSFRYIITADAIPSVFRPSYYPQTAGQETVFTADCKFRNTIPLCQQRIRDDCATNDYQIYIDFSQIKL